jgi:DNA-binding NarL/FixJ family response regulator
MQKLRVVVVDDHRLILEAVRLSLNLTDDIEVVGETDRGTEVLALVRDTKPDLVLLDYLMPDLDGLFVLDQLRRAHPDVSVVMLSGLDDPALIREALRRGASAFVVKRLEPAELAAALRQAASGRMLKAFDTPPPQRGAEVRAGLGRAETRVLEALTRGLTNKQIAKELYVAEETVKHHLKNIYKKLRVANRTEAVRYALDHGLAGNPFLRRMVS